MMKPMKAESIALSSIKPYLDDPEIVVQQKVDGDRIMVVVEDGHPTILNRDGELRSLPTPKKLIQAFVGLPGSWVFDGELLDELWLFDMPRVHNGVRDVVKPTDPYHLRLAGLEQVYVSWQPDPIVRLLPTARTSWAKASLVDRVLSSGGEGVVLKHIKGTYRSGKRSSQMLKAKHEKTIDCIVTAVRVDGKNNCHVSVFEHGHLTEVGSCAMLGKPAVRIGDVAEVKYLYADTNRRLVQPAFLRVRHDKSPTDCTIDQLAFTNRTVIDHGGLIMPTRTRREPSKGLGPTQQRLLLVLGFGAKTIHALQMEGFTASSAYSGLNRLANRGLVDRKFSYNVLEYFLTTDGVAVEKALNRIEEDEEELAS